MIKIEEDHNCDCDDDDYINDNHDSNDYDGGNDGDDG